MLKECGLSALAAPNKSRDPNVGGFSSPASTRRGRHTVRSRDASQQRFTQPETQRGGFGKSSQRCCLRHTRCVPRRRANPARVHAACLKRVCSSDDTDSQGVRRGAQALWDRSVTVAVTQTAPPYFQESLSGTHSRSGQYFTSDLK